MTLQFACAEIEGLQLQSSRPGAASAELLLARMRAPEDGGVHKARQIG